MPPSCYPSGGGAALCGVSRNGWNAGAGRRTSTWPRARRFPRSSKAAAYLNEAPAPSRQVRAGGHFPSGAIWRCMRPPSVGRRYRRGSRRFTTHDGPLSGGKRPKRPDVCRCRDRLQHVCFRSPRVVGMLLEHGERTNRGATYEHVPSASTICIPGNGGERVVEVQDRTAAAVLSMRRSETGLRECRGRTGPARDGLYAAFTATGAQTVRFAARAMAVAVLREVRQMDEPTRRGHPRGMALLSARQRRASKRLHADHAGQIGVNALGLPAPNKAPCAAPGSLKLGGLG